jgi:hypothetical protein
VIHVTWPQALAWRIGRHEIDPRGHLPADDVVHRLSLAIGRR